MNDVVRTLRVGDHFWSFPCDIVIRHREGPAAFAWCSPCQSEHWIDAKLYEEGKGPWKRKTRDEGT